MVVYVCVGLGALVYNCVLHSYKCVCVRMYAYVGVVCMIVYVCVRLCAIAYDVLCVLRFMSVSL